ncbi:MAG TPA: YaiI/YqxD family protein [Bacteriovoracaceae bacterium]|nr:YaiI/YqxD family protein [Bacteriovoracaceae bacterium]
MDQPPRIWIDADACPKSIKEIVYRASYRLKLPVTLVANSYMAVPPGTLVTSIQVEKGSDMADHYIVEHVGAQDIVITADIPLAAFVVEKGALALDQRGELYTEENVRERLSMRDFMKDIRDSGVVTAGPAPYGSKDVERFSNSLNKILTRLKL